MSRKTGGCNCGKVSFQVEGNPIRVGVCHCEICRKATGSSFNCFAVWSAENVVIVGDQKAGFLVQIIAISARPADHHFTA